MFAIGEMMRSDHCIVYILTNEAMAYILKYTTRRPISTHARPLHLWDASPFECHYALVETSKNVEGACHRAFDKSLIKTAIL